MQARKLIAVARRLVGSKREEDWRTIANRAYYGLMLECRETLIRWGFMFPKGDIHRAVRLLFDSPSNADLQPIGIALDSLSQLRSKADYDLTSIRFVNDADAVAAVVLSEQAIVDLDAINADAIKRAAAIADIQSRFP